MNFEVKAVPKNSIHSRVSQPNVIHCMLHSKVEGFAENLILLFSGNVPLGLAAGVEKFHYEIERQCYNLHLSSMIKHCVCDTSTS